MAFTLNTRKVNDVVVVDMSGQLGAGEAVLLLRNTVRRFMEDGNRKFVLNLGQVNYVDSSGLGELVTTYTSARNRQGDVKLLNLSKIAKDILQVTKLLTVFDVFDDETKARVTARTPVRRLGNPEDIGHAVLYLSTPAGSFVSGASLVVDGGMSVGLF